MRNVDHDADACEVTHGVTELACVRTVFDVRSLHVAHQLKTEHQAVLRGLVLIKSNVISDTSCRIRLFNQYMPYTA